MSNQSPSDLTRTRLTRWIETAKPVQTNPTWVERRLAIDYGDYTYIVGSGQVFQCPGCGKFDPEWTATEVLNYFKDVHGIKPYEIEVTCGVAMVEDES
jgi:hypothetical protein